MRTTLDLDTARIDELMKLIGARTKTEAIHRAIDDCIRAHKRSLLQGLSGKVRIEEDWRALRARDR